DRSLVGHSDADVALHALTDAILGALAEGDIGAHFPPSDPQWRNASSDRFLAFAVERVKARGGRIAHLDLTLVCEAPKIGPHRDAMRAGIARLAHIAIERVAAKASRPTPPPRSACPGVSHEERKMSEELRAAATAVLEACRARGLKVATAESCTGGLVAGALTHIARSSDVLDRGFVTYSNEAKQQMLGVPTDTIKKYGAVSRD